MQFAICAMKVKNRPMVNEVLGGEEALKKKLKQLEKENGQLRDKLSSVSLEGPQLVILTTFTLISHSPPQSESSLTEEKKREVSLICPSEDISFVSSL